MSQEAQPHDTLHVLKGLRDQVTERLSRAAERRDRVKSRDTILAAVIAGRELALDDMLSLINAEIREVERGIRITL